MCGVAGIINPKFTNELNLTFLTKMLSRISHRGPDESGIYLGNGVALGNVRLSIIDIATGQQPMQSPDNKLCIVFNGEIFNYKELRVDLINKGHTFLTNSDTEVLLHAYREYKEKCLNKLNGQFVFAIWDCEKQELFIARDRIGIRPLFFYHSNDTFVFASEVKAILEYSNFTPELNVDGLSQVFTFWNCSSPTTMFKNIIELSPGHYLKIRSNEIRISKYWNLTFGEKNNSISIEAAIEQFESLLEDAVRIRLRADVPVAAYLSGGLDSSATTRIIKSIVPEQLQTYSIGFSDKEFDETFYQNEVSTKLNTKHNPFYCNSEDISNIFPLVIWHAETPLTRTAPAPMYILSKKVHEQNIKVVITGEGADEMLGGYDIFKESMIRQFWAKQPHSQIRPILLKKLYPYIPQISKMNSRMLKFVFGIKLEETDHPFYSHLLRWHNTGSIQRYLSTLVKDKLTNYNPIDELIKSLPGGFLGWSNLEKAQWIESTIFLSGYLLSSQGDRMAMANSVEGRYPFLDYRIIEFCNTLPDNFKLNGLNEKYILKKLMKGKLPESVLKRPKQAYRAPIVSSFISNPPEYLHDLINDRTVKRINLFNPALVNNLFKKAFAGEVISEIDAMAITGIISSQLFYEIFFNNNKAYKPSLNLLTPNVILQPNL